jgi:predicted nucleic acid-binding protein
MRTVVADTGPLNYLVLIGAIDILPKLFDQMLAPQTVCDELADDDTPTQVRTWITQAPYCFTFRPAPSRNGGEKIPTLDAGEHAAIALAVAIKADLVLLEFFTGPSAASGRRERPFH